MKLNVKLPEAPNKEHPYLTRFQAHNPPHFMGATLLGIDADPAETVASLKAKVAGAPLPAASRRPGGGRGLGGDGVANRRSEAAPPPSCRRAARCQPSSAVAHLTLNAAALCGGSVPEMLRKGGTPNGVVLRDSDTLAACGLDGDMGVFEHLWVDSAANQASFREEYEKVRPAGAWAGGGVCDELCRSALLVSLLRRQALRNAQMAGFVKTQRDLLDATTNE
jgi:hypothetical protein